MIVSEYIDVKITAGNINWYTSKGYSVTKKEIAKVYYEDLSVGCRQVLDIKCDYCNSNFNRSNKEYQVQYKKCVIKKDACGNCRVLKMEEANLEKYGVTNVMHLESSKETLKKSLLDKYGVDHISKLEENKEKIKNTNLIKYGETSYFKTEEFKENLKNNNISKYGTEHYMSTDDFKTKSKKAMMEKYNTIHPMHSAELKNKAYITNIEKYGNGNVLASDYGKVKIREFWLNNHGVDHYSKTEEFKSKMSDNWSEWRESDKFENILNKRIQTSMARYGVSYPMQNSEVKSRAMNALYKNGTAPTSKQQLHIYNLLGGELNYVVGRSFLDVAFTDSLIYLEYDGGGHDLQVKLGNLSQSDFDKKERNRYFYLKDLGWKEVRIISENDKLHNDTKIKSFVEKAKDFLICNKCSSIRWNMDCDKVSISYKKFINYDVFMNIESEVEYIEFINRITN